jgi:hypothetical protein
MVPVIGRVDGLEGPLLAIDVLIPQPFVPLPDDGLGARCLVGSVPPGTGP